MTTNLYVALLIIQLSDREKRKRMFRQGARNRSQGEAATAAAPELIWRALAPLPEPEPEPLPYLSRTQIPDDPNTRSRSLGSSSRSSRAVSEEAA